MSSGTPPDWDPRSEAVQADQRAAYDEMRERCPVAYSDFLGWSLFRHQDVLRVLNDPDTFSSVVSAHPAVPNGMDPPEHTGYRRIAANRDSRVFEDAQAFRLGRDAAANLLYGAGIHVCPGAPLARMELRVAAEELLARTSRIEPISDRPPTCARYPAGGLATLFLRIR